MQNDKVMLPIKDYVVIYADRKIEAIKIAIKGN